MVGNAVTLREEVVHPTSLSTFLFILHVFCRFNFSPASDWLVVLQHSVIYNVTVVVGDSVVAFACVADVDGVSEVVG